MTDIDQTPRNDKQNIQGRAELSNDLANSIFDRYQVTRFALSPWIQRTLGDMQAPEPQVARKATVPTIALSSNNSLMLADRVQRMGERSVVWRAEEISLAPDMVDRFASDITNHFYLQPIAIRGELEKADLPSDTTALPLAGESSFIEPQAPAKRERGPTTPATSRPVQRQGQPESDAQPPVPPHFMAQRQDRRPSWLPERKEKPASAKPSVDIASQKQQTARPTSKTGPKSQNLRLFSQVDYLTDMGKSPVVEEIPQTDEMAPVEDSKPAPSTQIPRSQTSSKEKVDDTERTVQMRAVEEASQTEQSEGMSPPSQQIQVEQPSRSESATLSKSLQRRSKEEPPADATPITKIQPDTGSEPQPKTGQSRPDQDVASRKPDDTEDASVPLMPIENDPVTNVNVDTGEEDIEPITFTPDVPKLDRGPSVQRLTELPLAAPKVPSKTGTPPDPSLASPPKLDQPAPIPAKPQQSTRRDQPPPAPKPPVLPQFRRAADDPAQQQAAPIQTSESETSLQPDVSAEGARQSTTSDSANLGRQPSARPIISPQLSVTRPLPLTTRGGLLSSLPLVTAKQARSRLQVRGWRFKQKKSEQQSDPAQVNRTVETLQQSGDTGRPLPDTARNIAEQALGHDFSQVRLHKAQLAPLNVDAATRGQDVYMDAAQQNFDTPESLGVLGHELTHVAQQGLVQTKPVNETVVLAQTRPKIEQSSPTTIEADEREANRNEQRVLNYLQRQPIAAKSTPVASRSGSDDSFRTQPGLQPPAMPEPVAEWLASQETVQRYPLVTPSPPHQISRQEAGEVADSGAASDTETEDEDSKEQQPDLDQLARQIYPLIKQMIRVERERRPNNRNTRLGSF